MSRSNNNVMEQTIHRLNPDEWELWKSFRLEALRQSPESFGSSYEEEIVYCENDHRLQLKNNFIWGSWHDDRLVGVVGFFTSKRFKTLHCGTMFGLYVKESARGRGIATALIQTLMTHARTQVSQIQCCVVTENADALNLYLRLGFQIYGTAPKALKIGNQFYDEHLMMLPLA